MSITLLGNRYVSELLIMMLERRSIMSHEMKEVSTNHKYVSAAAQWMIEEELVTVGGDPKHPRRKIWELTSLGTQVASLLADAERLLKTSRLERMRPDIHKKKSENPSTDTHTGERRC